MSREWKPGDVAADVDSDERAMVVASRAMGCPKFHPDEPHWHYASSDWNPINVDSVRPLVVIDPENLEQVERFREIASRWADDVPYDEGPGDLNYTTAMQAALREFANPKPPKPDEPTGRYAVVVDAEGAEWLRRGSGIWHEQFVSNSGLSPKFRIRHYEDIAAVRVLSEGVTE